MKVLLINGSPHENGCTFTSQDFGFGGQVIDATFDAQTKTFSLQKAGENVGNPVVFDDLGRVVCIAMPGSQSGGFVFSYDEQGWPQGDVPKDLQPRLNSATKKKASSNSAR